MSTCPIVMQAIMLPVAISRVKPAWSNWVSAGVGPHKYWKKGGISLRYGGVKFGSQIGGIEIRGKNVARGIGLGME